MSVTLKGVKHRQKKLGATSRRILHVETHKYKTLKIFSMEECIPCYFFLRRTVEVFWKKKLPLMICTKLENARIQAEDMVGFHSITGE